MSNSNPIAITVPAGTKVRLLTVEGGGQNATATRDTKDYVLQEDITHDITNELIFKTKHNPANVLLDQGYRVFSYRVRPYYWEQFAICEEDANKVVVHWEQHVHEKPVHRVKSVRREPVRDSFDDWADDMRQESPDGRVYLCDGVYI